MATPSRQRQRELVLVGGGHAHVQVLRQLAMEPIDDTRLTVVLDMPLAVYSGMVPGFVAGQYVEPELEIDVVPLARRAGASVVLSAAVGVDAERRRIELVDRPPIAYDVASFDIGSTVAGVDLPGVREHTLPTRPIASLVRRAEPVLRQIERTPPERPFRLAVVGAGAGGVELAFALRARLAAADVPGVTVTLIQGGDAILPDDSDSLRARVLRAMEHRGIEVLCGRRVVGAGPGRVQLEGGAELDCHAAFWVTGAVASPLFRSSGLPTDSRGFVRTVDTLQIEGEPALFAVGDCATMVDYDWMPKAGVYAVRQGPYLSRNLRRWLESGTPLRYRPQRDFLSLLNLGDGTAIGAKWGRSFEGRWVMRLKDWIDRRFMRRFQVLEDDGALTDEFASQPEMDGGEMLCGGCAAKVGQSTLERALQRVGGGPPDTSVVLGLDTPDDAAGWQMPSGETVVSSLDAFRSFLDDPYLVGRVAAINAVSDLEATGVEPRYAQALVVLPSALEPDQQEEQLFQVLSGARATLDPLGVTLLGGHTTTGPELLVGFNVEGLAARDALLLKGGLAPGDRLLLTKPVGTGVLLHADMQGRARGPWLQAALASMLLGNGASARAARAAGARAMTDVTGFGLVGHLGEMMRASGTSVILELDAIATLPGARELIAQGLRSTFHEENARARRGIVIRPGAAAHPDLELLFDPQTSGGLLFGVGADRVDAALDGLRSIGATEASVVGVVGPPRDDGAPIEVVASFAGDLDAAARLQPVGGSGT